MYKNVEWPANKFNIIKFNNHNSKAPSPKGKEIEFRCLPNKGLCINNIISIRQNYQLLLHKCLPNFHTKRTTPVYLHENNVQKLRPSFPITHFGLMAVIKNNFHTLKSSWVAKQLNNLIKKKAEITKNYIPHGPSQRPNGIISQNSYSPRLWTNNKTLGIRNWNQTSSLITTTNGVLLKTDLIHHLQICNNIFTAVEGLSIFKK